MVRCVRSKVLLFLGICHYRVPAASVLDAVFHSFNLPFGFRNPDAKAYWLHRTATAQETLIDSRLFDSAQIHESIIAEDNGSLRYKI